MKTIVISGINLVDGGTLSIFKDSLNSMIDLGIHKKYKVIIFVSRKEIFKEYDNKMKVLELPLSKKSYFFRLYYEYIFFYKFSKRNKIDTWISIHDMTPNILAKTQYVYCHNSTPFAEKTLNVFKYSMSYIAMTFLYKYIYRFNIKKNKAIIVQQNWIKKEFQKLYGINNIIVARPNLDVDFKYQIHLNKQKQKKKKIQFIYPSYPREFKNFEVVCEACRQLNRKDYEVILTLDGTENKYSKRLYKKYSDISNIKWIGLQKREYLFQLYGEVDCMIFASKLETWGLPISEFKCTNKPMLLSELPYAHETIGEYEKVNFFDPDDVKSLVTFMEKIILNVSDYAGNSEIPIEGTMARNWNELWNIMLEDKE